MKDSNRNGGNKFPPETHIKRQVTQHDCPSILLGDGGTKEVEKCTMRKQIFCTGPTRAAKAGQKSLVPAPRAQSTNQLKDSFVILESPFASVSAVSRGHPTLMYLVAPITIFPLTPSHPTDGLAGPCLCLLTSLANLRRLQHVAFCKNIILW
jgi:hypothetical protein